MAPQDMAVATTPVAGGRSTVSGATSRSTAALASAQRPPIVWSIAGSDSGAGAGIQADQRAFDAFDVFGCTAIAASPRRTRSRSTRSRCCQPSCSTDRSPHWRDDLPPRAIKIGLLGSADNVRCVARWVDRLRAQGPVALVVDPVWRASSGRDLAGHELRHALLGELLPRASLITPNRAEAAWLLGVDARDLAAGTAVEQAARALRGLGAGAVVVTGGDVDSALAADRIETAQARGWLALPRIAVPRPSRQRLRPCRLGGGGHGARLLRRRCARAGQDGGDAGSERRPSPEVSGRAVVRPRAGFARIGSLLPRLSADWPMPIGPAAQHATLVDPDLGLYAVVDSADRVARVLAAGVRSVQLRIKDAATPGLSREIERSVGLAACTDGAAVHQRPLAARARARCLRRPSRARRIWSAPICAALRRAGMRIGLSSHSPWEVCRALAQAPSYIACGPLHPTITKDMPWLPQGPDNLAYWCRMLDLPVVTIGGIDAPRAHIAASCGAAGVAVLRGIMQASDPTTHIAVLQRAIRSGRAAVPHPAPDLPASTLRV